MPRGGKLMRWGSRVSSYAKRAKLLRAGSFGKVRGGLGAAEADAGAPARRKTSARLRLERTILNLHEPKFYNDAQYTVAECASDLVLAKIDMPPQGDGISERDGDRIFVNWLKVRGHITKQENSNTEYVRVFIFRWLLDDALTVPVTGDVLDTAVWGTGNGVMAPYRQQPNTERRYEILYDKKFSFSIQVTGIFPVTYFSAHIPINQMVDFTAAGITGKNMIYMGCITGTAAAAAVGPVVTCRSVMQFRDV